MGPIQPFHTIYVESTVAFIVMDTFFVKHLKNTQIRARVIILSYPLPPESI